MKRFHHAIRSQGLLRGLEQQMNRQARFVESPWPVVSHYPNHPVAGVASPTLGADIQEEPHRHVLAEGDR